jgi:hypothetical protein
VCFLAVQQVLSNQHTAVNSRMACSQLICIVPVRGLRVHVVVDSRMARFVRDEAAWHVIEGCWDRVSDCPDLLVGKSPLCDATESAGLGCMGWGVSAAA